MKRITVAAIALLAASPALNAASDEPALALLADKASVQFTYPMAWQRQLKSFQTAWVANMHNSAIDQVVTGSITHQDQTHQ